MPRFDSKTGFFVFEMKNITYLNTRFLIVLITIFNFSFAQNDTVSILNRYTKIKAQLQSNTDSCLKPILKSIEDCKTINFHKGTTQFYLLLSNYYLFKGQPDSVLPFVNEMEKAAQLFGDSSHRISVYLKTALIFSDRGDFKEAVSKALQAQKFAERYSNLSVRAKIYHDLGYIYNNKELHATAISYFKKGLKFAERAKDTFSIANLCARIGGSFNESFLPDSALAFNKRSLQLFQKIKVKRGLGAALNNLAGTYDLKHDYNKAIEYYLQALQIRQELGDEYALTILYYNLGVSYSYLKEFKKAKVHLESALLLARKQQNVQMVAQILKQLTKVSAELNDLKSYKEFAEEYIQLKDSITAKENIKAISELQNKYEAEKREQSIVALKAEVIQKEEKHLLEKKNKSILLISAIVIIVLLTVSGFIVYRRYRITEKQNKVIEKQRQESEQQRLLIEEKQKEILDSIHYAKRIQNALLSNDTYFLKVFNRLKK